MAGQLKPFIFADTIHLAAEAVGEKAFYASRQVELHEDGDSVQINFCLQVEGSDHYRDKFLFLQIHRTSFYFLTDSGQRPLSMRLVTSRDGSIATYLIFFRCQVYTICTTPSADWMTEG